MKLAEICSLAASSSRGDVEWSIDAKDIFEAMAVIRGRKTWADAEAGWYYAPGLEPTRLNPSMEFTDAYMHVEYVSHYPIALLFFHENEAALVQAILSDGGYFNAFTTLAVAFRHGVVSPFTCFSDTGEFSKIGQARSERPFEAEYTGRRLVWAASPN